MVLDSFVPLTKWPRPDFVLYRPTAALHGDPTASQHHSPLMSHLILSHSSLARGLLYSIVRSSFQPILHVPEFVPFRSYFNTTLMMSLKTNPKDASDTRRIFRYISKVSRQASLYFEWEQLTRNASRSHRPPALILDRLGTRVQPLACQSETTWQ